MGQDIVFPAAGFIAMAVEALYQARQATDPIEEDLLNTQYRYRLRNSTFPKALVLEEKGPGAKVMLSLSRHQDSWYEFVVSSLTGEAWSEHSRGLIRLEKAPRLGNWLKTPSYREMLTISQLRQKLLLHPWSILHPLVFGIKP